MKKITIEIPDEEYKVLESRVNEKKEFKDVESYILDIIKQVADKIKEETNQDEAFSEEDEEKVKERLRDLGYLE